VARGDRRENHGHTTVNIRKRYRGHIEKLPVRRGVARQAGPLLSQGAAVILIKTEPPRTSRREIINQASGR